MSDAAPPTDTEERVESTDSTETAPSGTVTDAGETPPLRVRNLRKTFSGITAVDDTSFEIEEGKITGLIGPNGAGKSTTFNLITGFLTPDSGTVELYGEDVTGMRPYKIADRGMVRTFQIARELSEMTVLENMMLAPKHQRGEALWRSVLPGARSQVERDEAEVLERAWEMLEFFDIDHLAEEYAGNLSGGQRKLLEMARALMTDPDILLLDEPFAGVNPSLEEKLIEHIHELREQGYTFLLVEHDIDLIMNNCSRVLVLHQGRLLADGPPAAIKSDERVIEAYLGGEVE
ncbi:branched-chain amino acid transport system ATP-binding protein [Halogranum amylolyticum]|uniref:Probable branched-chain amino acid transport ATP-binding protein LivG n=1 Tax=Halogranum amylolyticum TaxID=660520 RepID=A0A1H8S0A2_9EURY|nr:ABC transporter ATP-binding protein [Halogranum amylolyticum]SEO72100.1 branched-chain amino acid transport system ATP-binding protein [Halogranum amylolyticum]